MHYGKFSLLVQSRGEFHHPFLPCHFAPPTPSSSFWHLAQPPRRLYKVRPHTDLTATPFHCRSRLGRRDQVHFEILRGCLRPAPSQSMLSAAIRIASISDHQD